MAKSPAPFSRIFVLDTNVLLHDPQSLFKFAEHAIYIPFVTLEELDNKKVGNQDINRNARQATRLMDEIVSQPGFDMNSGFPLANFNGRQATGRMYLQRESLPFLANEHVRKNDNLYLSVLAHLTKTYPKAKVIMVTKDLNLRIKARALDYLAEDYKHDHAVEDADLIYRGIRTLENGWDSFGVRIESWKQRQSVYYRVPAGDLRLNEFLVIDGDLYQVVQLEEQSAVLLLQADTAKAKNAVMGITARNEEQQAALSLLTNPEIDLVALLGPAGTGKTLLTLAAALSQTEKDSRFDSIVFTRATIALGEEIGFLPGTEEDKLRPWLGALEDSIDVLAGAKTEGNGEHAESAREELAAKVQIRAMTFMRGRTFHRKYLIIDEAQNLTPKQMKALITRAGEGTKVVCLGNLAQIDSPYLSETSSGLAYLVERFKGWPHFGSLVLSKGERSRLASEGNDRL